MRERDHIAALRSRAFLVLVGALFLSGCDMVVLNPAGDIAVQQRNLILFATAVMLLIIVPVLVLTVVFAWRYRRGNPNKNYDPEFDHSTTLELVIWACPLLIIIALSAVTWTHTHLLDPFRPLERLGPGRPVAKGTKPLEVQVVALEWKWLFIYPEQGIATVNDLALPVDVPVRFSITSTDQFATFYAPTLAGMIYAMPGMDSKLNAVLNKPGQTWGYSGNYTGEGHSTMRFRLTGLRLADFDRWARQVKQGGGLPLEASRYLALEKPSEKVPFMRFSSVSPTLFDRIVNRCVESGRPCMNQTMNHDMRHGGGSPDAGGLGSGTMPGHGSMPAPGGKPEAALEKDAGDKGSSPKVGMPVGPDYNARGRDAEKPAKPQTPKAQANP
ncbi:ubiquinol oxidase subunit II [Novosphingobium fluoreni]|uniref:ubiquinol oxidase subunit II n=1 Tax=Novosphingobium fluoreni TaxID=1391222 RepID=UPI003DA13BB9